MLAQRHVHDDRLDEHLGKQHVQFVNDALDPFHVLPRGKNQQRIAPLVGDDFRLAENLDLILPVPRRLLDDGLQPLLESEAPPLGVPLAVVVPMPPWMRCWPFMPLPPG